MALRHCLHGCKYLGFAWSKILTAHPWTYHWKPLPAFPRYRPSLDIKKATLESRVAKQVISLMRESVPCELLAAVHMTTTIIIIILIKVVKKHSHLILGNSRRLSDHLLVKGFDTPRHVVQQGNGGFWLGTDKVNKLVLGDRQQLAILARGHRGVTLFPGKHRHGPKYFTIQHFTHSDVIHRHVGTARH